MFCREHGENDAEFGSRTFIIRFSIYLEPDLPRDRGMAALEERRRAA